MAPKKLYSENAKVNVLLLTKFVHFLTDSERWILKSKFLLGGIISWPIHSIFKAVLY
jgi:hypothetical protein